MEPQISVIVPIYNVAPYLRKCLDSLRNQTMREIEVICIDDGSTDGSGEIAEEYVTDSRFRVIHTVNFGLSAARNRGINEAKAEWLMFVDSDDWVDEDFCRIPYETAIESGADMVIFGRDLIKKGRIRKNILDNDSPMGLVDEHTAHEYGFIVVWNKLYKKSLFENLRYPEGRVYEDVALTHKIVHKAQRIFMIWECLYHYVIRKNSISFVSTPANRRDGALFSFFRCDDLLLYGYPIEKLKASLCSAAIGVLANVNQRDSDIYLKAKNTLNNMDKAPRELSLKSKIGFIAWKHNKSIFYFLCKLTGRMGCDK